MNIDPLHILGTVALLGALFFYARWSNAKTDERRRSARQTTEASLVTSAATGDALTKCPDCGSEVSRSALACPKCGRPMPAPVENARRCETDGTKFTGNYCPKCGQLGVLTSEACVTAAEAQAKKKKLEHAIGLGCAGIMTLMILSCGGFLPGCDSPFAAQQQQRSAATGASVDFEPWYVSRQFVERRLAPKKTSFPNPHSKDFAGQEKSGNGWRTWGYVDTVNDYNAAVRRHWAAEVEREGAEWKLKALVFKD